MVRDWNRDEAYFDRFIEGRGGLAREAEGWHERGEVREDRVASVSRGLVRDLLELTLASYSRGDPMPEVARRLRVDDSALEGRRYYPYELTRWLDGGEGE